MLAVAKFMWLYMLLYVLQCVKTCKSACKTTSSERPDEGEYHLSKSHMLPLKAIASLSIKEDVAPPSAPAMKDETQQSGRTKDMPMTYKETNPIYDMFSSKWYS